MKIKIRVQAVQARIEKGQFAWLQGPGLAIWGSDLDLQGTDGLEPGEACEAIVGMHDKRSRMAIQSGDHGLVLEREQVVGTFAFLHSADGRLLGSLPERLPELWPGEPLVPALLLGFDGRDPCTSEWDTVSTAIPRWLVNVEHQAGGQACERGRAVGALFRLGANLDHAIQDPGSLMEAFRWMAEEPDLDSLSRFHPDLAGLCLTRGKPYEFEELQTLERRVHSCFSLPRFTDGMEAFVGMDRAESGASVMGWQMTTISSGVELLDWDAPEGTWSDGPSFQPSHLELLEEIGCKVFAEPRGPRLFLLWENSD